MQIGPRGGLRGGFGFGIPIDAQLAAQRHIAQQRRGSGAMPDLDVADRPLARLDALEKVRPVRHVGVVAALDGYLLERRALLRVNIVTGAIDEQRSLRAVEQNAVAVLDHGIRVTQPIFISSYETGILVRYL